MPFECLTLGVQVITPTQKLLEAIRNEPLLIFYTSGESHYVAWNVVMPIGSRKMQIDSWYKMAPFEELVKAINRVCELAGDSSTINLGSIRLYIKYPYVSNNADKLTPFRGHVS